MRWKQFSQLSGKYRQKQIELLAGACPETMSIKSMYPWAKLLDKVSSHAESKLSEGISEDGHWETIQALCLEQFKRIGEQLVSFVDDVDNPISTQELCQSLEILEMISRWFQTESEKQQRSLAAEGELDQIPESVNTDTLATLARLRRGYGG